MSALTASARNAFPVGAFALPGTRQYPVNDRAHAANAKARASQAAKKGKISESTKAKIFAAANKKLGKEQ